MPDHELYDIRREADGTWTVFEVATDATVILNNEPQSGFDVQDPDHIADSLEAIARRTAGRGTKTKQ